MIRLQGEIVTIALDVVEVETTRMPSFRAAVEVVFTHPTGHMTYQSSSLWFGIEDWDALSSALETGSGTSEIADLSYDVIIRLSETGRQANVSMQLRRRIAGLGEGDLTLKFRESSAFTEQFRAFARSVRQAVANLS